jgi:Abnormal spindle-like microcephaly-assoc'd, ASPM-SPD-2-Hydin
MSSTPPPAGTTVFVITTTTSELRLDSSRKGQVTYTVTNTTQQNLRARADVVPEANAQKGWFTVVDPERDAPIGSTQQFTVQVAVPGDVAPGSYRFRLDVADPQNPDELSGEGPWTTLVVPAPPPPPRPLPWLWILIAVGVVVLLAIAGTVAFILTRPKPPQRTQVTVAATVQSFGTVQVGSASLGSIITVRNAGDVETTVTTAVSGSNKQDFKVLEDTCNQSKLPARQACQVQIDFEPQSQGDKEATFSVTADRADSPGALRLTGTGRGVAAIAFTPPAATISLSGRTVSTIPTAGSTDVAVKNAGTANLRISTVSVDDPSARFKLVANTCTNVVLTPGGNSCSATVQLAAFTLGTFTARLLVFDDQPGSPHVAPVSGSRTLIFCPPKFCVITTFKPLQP